MPTQITSTQGNWLTASSVEAFGASWVAAYGASATKYGAVQRMSKLIGATLTNQSLNGAKVTADAGSGGVAALMQNATIAAANDLTAGPYFTPGGLKLCFTGANDYSGWNGLTQGNANVENALTLAYSRLLAARVINALKAGPALDTVNMTYGSNWTAFADTTISSGLGYAFTTVAGSFVDVTIDAAYNREAITVFFPLAANDTKFNGEVKIDGVQVATYNTAQYQVNLVAAAQNGIGCIRIPANTLTAGAHTLRFTALTISGTYATFGGVIIEGTAPLLIPSAPPMPQDTPTKTQFAWANARNQAAMVAFPSARWVDLTSAMSPNTGTGSEAADLAYWNASTPGHPNNIGYGRITQQLAKAAQTVTLSELGAMS